MLCHRNRQLMDGPRIRERIADGAAGYQSAQFSSVLRSQNALLSQLILAGRTDENTNNLPTNFLRFADEILGTFPTKFSGLADEIFCPCRRIFHHCVDEVRRRIASTNSARSVLHVKIQVKRAPTIRRRNSSVAFVGRFKISSVGFSSAVMRHCRPNPPHIRAVWRRASANPGAIANSAKNRERASQRFSAAS